MNTKLFLSTFVLIFLAELGDKTQLAAMARAAAGVDAKWTVFLAASVALVLSTLIAVLLGSVLGRFLPEKAVKIAAGVLFIAFGILILVNAFAPRTAPAVSAQPGLVSGLVLRAAARFEEASVADYRKRAAACGDPAVREVLEHLADEEEAHLRHVRQADIDFADVEMPPLPAEALAEPARLPIGDRRAEDDILQAALAHERATAAFYGELSRVTPLPALRRIFARLESEEQSHVRHLEDLMAVS